MAGRRVAHTSPDRRAALIILGVGTTAALACLVGGVWILRAGILLAIAMALAAFYFATRQLRMERAQHQEQMRVQVDQQRRLSEQHHKESLAMIERFAARTDNLKALVGSLQRQLNAAHGELSTLRGNAVWLRGEVAARQARIDDLLEEISTLNRQLAELNTSAPTVVQMPRHAKASGIEPAADDIWAEGQSPEIGNVAQLSVADVRAIAL